MNASFLEIVQTLASLSGAILAIPWMVAADLNLVTINRRSVNGNRRMIAATNVRLARSVALVQTLLFLVGLVTLFLAPPPYTAVPEGSTRDQITIDMIRNLSVTRIGMTMVSLVLVYVSYRSWLEERIPIQLARRTDRVMPDVDTPAGQATTPSLAVAAQHAASQAQAVAAIAQDSASAAQTTATMAQDVATDAHAAEQDTPVKDAT